MVRRLAIAFVAALAVGASLFQPREAPASASGAVMSAMLQATVPGVRGGIGWDLPGYDYRVFYPQNYSHQFDLSHHYQQCQNECLRDGRCRAMVLVEPRIAPSNRSTCYLKTAAPRQVRMAGVYSMVKAPEPGRMLHNFDLPGWDYRRFELDQPNAGQCMESCRQDGNCISWTYVHPGRQGPRAVCYLKNGFPGYVPRSECCISGSMR